jgi:hypothetical protein
MSVGEQVPLTEIKTSVTTALDFLSTRADLSLFHSSIQDLSTRADLSLFHSSIQGLPNVKTYFVPTDAAMNLKFQNTHIVLSDDAVKYHLVRQFIPAPDAYFTERAYETMSQGQMSLKNNSGVFEVFDTCGHQARVQEVVHVTDGILYIIDSVLLNCNSFSSS